MTATITYDLPHTYTRSESGKIYTCMLLIITDMYREKCRSGDGCNFTLTVTHFFLGLHCFSAVKLKTDENFSSFLSASLFRLRNNAWGSFTLCFTHSLYFTPYLLLLAQFPLPTSAIHHWETETKKKRNINLERGKLGWISIHLDFFVMSDCLQERIFGIGGGKKTRQTHTQCIHWMTNFILEKKRVKIEALPFLQQPDEGRKNVLKM